MQSLLVLQAGGLLIIYGGGVGVDPIPEGLGLEILGVLI